MNITQAYLTPDYDTTEDRKFLLKYQNETSYIQIFIEKFLKANQNDIGPFNRLVFSEGGNEKNDFCIVGNNAMSISITKTYQTISNKITDQEAHKYYVSKFLEGFAKFDNHFHTNLSKIISPLIDEQFKYNLFFEKEIAKKNIGKKAIKIIGRYSRRQYQLLIRCIENGNIYKESVAYECGPDNFIVQLNIRKAVIDSKIIKILDKCGNEYVLFKTTDFI